MRTDVGYLLLLLSLSMVDAAFGETKIVEVTTYSGPCDASAGAAIDGDSLIIANDEDNMLRMYRRGESSSPVHTIDLTSFLAADPKHPEADIEGAAGVGSRTYWITSHGRSREGKLRPSRYRFWATESRATANDYTLRPIGRPYSRMLEDLASDGKLKGYHFAEAGEKSPESLDALNIEGLSATPEGSLLIGFRSPLHQGRAILVPLINPASVITGMTAMFDPPIELDLKGRGIRGIEYWPARKTYVLIAGAANDEPTRSQLYLWSGEPGATPTAVEGIDLAGMQAESIIVSEDPTRLEIVLDDGSRQIKGEACKDLDASEQHFRIVTVTMDR